MDNSAYIEYVNSNESKIAKNVNDCFESSKNFIRTELISEIKEYLNPIPVHYDWRPDGNPYDISGEIIKNGYVLLDQTIDSFLENEYSGNTEATYISGMGLIYNTYGDELRYVTMQIAPDIMCSTIKENIENYFDVSLSDEDFEYIEDSCRAFDPIYDECLASDFFNYEYAVKFVDIGNIKLNEIDDL